MAEVEAFAWRLRGVQAKDSAAGRIPDDKDEPMCPALATEERQQLSRFDQRCRVNNVAAPPQLVRRDGMVPIRADVRIAVLPFCRGVVKS